MRSIAARSGHIMLDYRKFNQLLCKKFSNAIEDSELK